ncbi:MAG: D-hexose-6-phosphate mutarotase [Verrucomicrobiales bacterium]|nr:D-hexose-6-phosphate mutarotase [Verrucomicrobiales bacterium]
MEKIIGPAGAECYRIVHESGAEVTLARHGGHLISWKTADLIERLYLSPKAEFGTGKAIRGGVPVIFPQFSDHGPFGRHGFARKSEWMPDFEHGALTLQPTDETLADWPHAFELAIRPVLTETSLAIELHITNPGSEPISFQAALHTYLKISDHTKVTITGLEDLDFQDETTGKLIPADQTPIALGEEIDRAYFQSNGTVVQMNDGTHEIEITSGAFHDTVIWNPGPDHGIGDLPATDWQQFVCIEAARIQPNRIIEPGKNWIGLQRLEVK